MKLDLIIPTYHPDQKLERCLKMIAKQTRKPDHIIIMNTEKELFHTEIPKELENVKIYHIKKEQFDHGATRDLGTTHSDADLFMFMTQDAIPADEYVIEKIEEAFEDRQVAAVYGRQLASQKKNPIEAYTRKFNYPEESKKKTKKDLDLLGIKTFFCSNVCAAYRKDVYKELGGFEKHTIFNEDMIMASHMIDAGWAVYYEADAKVWHWHDYSAMQQLRRNFDLGVSQADHGEIFDHIKSEKEGIALVKNTIYFLWKTKRYTLIPKVIVHSGCKWVGYRLGKKYYHLPESVIEKLTMNPSYWKK